MKKFAAAILMLSLAVPAFAAAPVAESADAPVKAEVKAEKKAVKAEKKAAKKTVKKAKKAEKTEAAEPAK